MNARLDVIDGEAVAEVRANSSQRADGQDDAVELHHLDGRGRRPSDLFHSGAARPDDKTDPIRDAARVRAGSLA